MKSDVQIQEDVIDQLKWEPFLNVAEIGVTVKNGIVTLSGQVDSLFKKIAAEKATKMVTGVKAIAEDIQIDVSPTFDKTDAEIAEAVLNTLKSNSAIKEEKIKIKVEDGNVFLEGEVKSEIERDQARTAVENLKGVRSVINAISLIHKVRLSEIQKKINAAFHRSATIDSGRVTAEVIGSQVILYGRVRSFAEKEDAVKAAWSVPGVTGIENRLEMTKPEQAIEH